LVLIHSFESAEKAINVLPANPPDIVISDITLPGMKGTELIVRLKERMKQTQFMVCSIHDDNDTIFEALKCGASGYILKRSCNG
jgi:DNA-binding NarL/FixJ family response regulator